MSTIALKHPLLSVENVFAKYNKSALVSLTLALLFIFYFFMPQLGVFGMISNLSILFVVVFPLAAFILSALSLKQISQTHAKGITMSYIALGITTLYFIVAMAIPVVLIGLYVLYTFVI